VKLIKFRNIFKWIKNMLLFHWNFGIFILVFRFDKIYKVILENFKSSNFNKGVYIFVWLEFG